MPRKPSCLCGSCAICKARTAARKRYRDMTPAERRAWVERRDPQRVRDTDRVRYERDKEKRLTATAAYRQTPEGRESANRAKAKWIAGNPLKRRAQNAVANALRAGRLQRGSCEKAGVDCSGRIEAHHDDYTKPLDVRWLCRAHHAKEHKL